jgi:hypothetical protein
MSGPYDDGAVHMLEAVLASVLVISTLVMVNSYMVRHVSDGGDDLAKLSSDILNLITYRDNSLEHPGLGFTLSSMEQWNNSSSTLGADIEKVMPAGVYYHMSTPYGTLGKAPAERARGYSRPFIAYSGFGGGAGEMLDCKLVLWRA